MMWRTLGFLAWVFAAHTCVMYVLTFISLDLTGVDHDTLCVIHVLIESVLVIAFSYPFVIKLVEGNATTDDPVFDTTAPVSHYSVLVAEDDLVNQEVVSAMLEAIGVDMYKVVDNGQELLHEMTKGNYDIVLMDIQMPIMDGYATTKRLRELDKLIPVIALTSHTNGEALEKCIAAGMNDLLPKPFTGKTLKRMLIKWQVQQNS